MRMCDIKRHTQLTVKKAVDNNVTNINSFEI